MKFRSGRACDLIEDAVSVNAALDQLPDSPGKELQIAVLGILRIGPHTSSLDHAVKSERRSASFNDPPEASSIWLYFGPVLARFHEPRLQRWDGKEVVVRGALKAPAFHGGCGHLSAWPAELLARSIERP